MTFQNCPVRWGTTCQSTALASQWPWASPGKGKGVGVGGCEAAFRAVSHPQAVLEAEGSEGLLSAGTALPHCLSGLLWGWKEMLYVKPPAFTLCVTDTH